MTRNVVYRRTQERHLMLDVYWHDISKASPLVIWVHGGGFRQGRKDGAIPALWLLDHGYSVASLSYRFISEAFLPAAVEDVKAAVRWLRLHAADYKLDPDRFGSWGGSAGGYLAHMMAIVGGSDVFDGDELLDVPATIQAACSWCGPSDFLRMDEFPEDVTPHESFPGIEDKLRIFFGGPVKDKLELIQQANPVSHISSSTPPILLLHGEQDNKVTVNQSHLLYNALNEAGSIVEMETYPTLTHTFYQSDEQYEYVLNRSREFFDKYLKGIN